MILIAVGSSIGSAQNHFAAAEEFLQKQGIMVVQKSDNFMFPPWGGIAKNEFTNAVWQLKTDKSPDALLAQLQAAEDASGRDRSTRWGDRTLDLDILIYNDEKIETADLKLPHPGMLKRDFVLIPLLDLLQKLA